ncbi:MAG: DUF4194 domain-containing protein [Gammaproteobacteria bacterium]
MSDAWVDAFEEALQQAHINGEGFREALHRLLEYGAVVAGDTQPERRIYDTVTRGFSLFDNYLQQMGCRLYHDRQLEYLRLYPPGARIPGVEDDGLPAEGLRERLNQTEAATLMVLRFLYDQKLGEGQVDDDQEAAVQLDELTSLMSTALEQVLPTNLSERRQILRRLQRLKAIRVDPDADLQSPENWLFIRPMILTLVSPEWIEAVNQRIESTIEPDGESDVDNEGVADVD